MSSDKFIGVITFRFNEVVVTRRGMVYLLNDEPIHDGDKIIDTYTIEKDQKALPEGNNNGW